MRRHLLLLAVLSLALTACGSDGGGSDGGGGAGEATVDIEGFAFDPGEVTVTVGETVTWTNRDGVTHTVTSSGEVFTSGGVDAEGSFSFTFSETGTYDYFCSIHPSMTATVVVE